MTWQVCIWRTKSVSRDTKRRPVLVCSILLKCFVLYHGMTGLQQLLHFRLHVLVALIMNFASFLPDFHFLFAMTYAAAKYIQLLNSMQFLSFFVFLINCNQFFCNFSSFIRRLLLLDRDRQNGVVRGSSPPPTYRSHAGSLLR